MIPRLLANPFKPDARLSADLDGGRLGRGDRLLHGLHQVLRVPHKHLRRLDVLVRA